MLKPRIPELIALSAIITVLNHLAMWIYQGKKPEARITAVWFFTFGIPTVIFIIITLLTLWYSLANVAFQLPIWAVQVRGIAAYWYGIESLLYLTKGRPLEANRLREKDAAIDALNTQYNEDIARIRAELTEEKESITAQYNAEIARIQSELNEVYAQKEAAIEEKNAMYTTFNASHDTALEAYGKECIEWLNRLDKTVSIDAIAANTGINKRRLQTAIERKELRVRGTNKELIWTPSLREYLLKNATKQELKVRSSDTTVKQEQRLHVVQ